MRSPGKLFLGLMLLTLGVVGLLALGSIEANSALYGDSSDQLFRCRSCLESVAFASPREGWAVGEGNFLLHYHDGAWTWVSSPADNVLFDVTFVSEDEGWAVGEDILHYHAGRWSVAENLGRHGTLASVSMSSAEDGWAVGLGGDSNESEGILYHYHNGAWTQAPPVPNTILNGVAMVSADEGWAVGTRSIANTAVGGVILRYHDGTWSPVAPPVDVPFASIAMRSPADGWIVGPDFGGDAGVFLRYSDGAWRQVQRMPGINLDAVAVNATGQAWAAGARFDNSGTLVAPILYHYNGVLWSPAVLPDVSAYYGGIAHGGFALTDKNEVWLLGSTSGSSKGHGVMAHVTGGVSSVVAIPIKPPDSAILRLLFPVALAGNALLVAGIVTLFWLSLFAPRRSIWRAWSVRLILAGLLCWATSVEIVLALSIAQQDALLFVEPDVLAVIIASFLSLTIGTLVLPAQVRLRYRALDAIEEALRLRPTARLAARQHDDREA